MSESTEPEGADQVLLRGVVDGPDLHGWEVQVEADSSGEGWHLYLYAPGQKSPQYDAFADEWDDVFEFGDRMMVRWLEECQD